MKKYIQPEIELVKFTSETITGSIGTGTGSAEDNIFNPSDVVIP